MADLENYRQIIKKLLAEYARLPTPSDQIQNEVIFDSDHDRYLLLTVGWLKEKRIHHCAMNIDIINGQVWIQANHTDHLIAEELVTAGIPPESIVLGLQPPEIRPYTDYGIPHSEQPRESLPV
jgi:hypothetical protein